MTSIELLTLGGKEMKIAFVNQPIDTMPLPFRGGSMVIWTYEMSRRLAQFYDVIVYSKRGRFQKKAEMDQGVRYKRISTIADEWSDYLYAALDKLGRFQIFQNIRRILFFSNVRRPFFASRLNYLAYILQVAKDLRAEKCDIVHLHNFSQFVPIIRAFNPKIKIVLHMHCEWLTQLDRTVIEGRLEEVDLVIGCSEYITEKIRQKFPHFAKKCQTVYNGVDINQFSNESGKHDKKNSTKRLLFVGSVSPEKGLHVLLDAFQKVIELYPQAQLEIVGSKSSRRIEWLVALSDEDKVSNLASFYYGNTNHSYFYYLQKQLLSLNITNNVAFTGFVLYEQIVNHYRDAGILVNPSFSEAFGRSLIEAMACQVPVVATRVGGMKEIVADGETGILVNPGDSTALAKAILHLLSDEDLRSSMGKVARKRAVELFSWEQIVEKLLCQYKNICDANG
jgi:glycosyltransferase involved in cell wall biosynthesis